jgi:two-component system sensor histidine kinase ChvG
MASDTATRKPKDLRARVRFAALWLARSFTSRLGWSIIGVNLAALAVLLIGMVALTENRRGLVDAKVDSLSAQAEIIGNVITETAVRGDPPGPRMNTVGAREVLTRLSRLYVPDETRALIHAPGPQRIADSDLIAGEVEESELPPPGEVVRETRSLMDRAEDGFARLFQSAAMRAQLNRSLDDEVKAAFATGEPQTGLRRGADGRRVVSVTIPIQLIQAVVGTVTYESYDFDELVASERAVILPYAVTAFIAIMAGALWLTASIARPVRRLADAAREVRLAGGRRVGLPDMTKRRDEIGDMGRAFTQMTDALYDRLDAIESFAADVSHEIKNPLTSIRSAAEILPIANTDEKRARLIKVIQHDVNRIDRLITDISNASRLDAELTREDLARLDAGRLLKDIAALHRREDDGVDPGDRVDVRVALKDADLFLRGHEGPLGRVFINLVENAVTFSPPGGIVTVTGRRRGAGASGQVIVTVEDEGPGIPDDSLETIFDRFYTQRPQGAAFGSHSGLGLAIARQIVTAHGGRIRAENRAAQTPGTTGARFTVELPWAGH